MHINWIKVFIAAIFEFFLGYWFKEFCCKDFISLKIGYKDTNYKSKYPKTKIISFHTNPDIFLFFFKGLTGGLQSKLPNVTL